jgi:hypothetical protein
VPQDRGNHDTTGQSRFMVFPSTDPDNSTGIATGIENETTARLIAAAPNMLAVLKNIARCAATSDEWLVAVRAAIAKAESKS